MVEGKDQGGEREKIMVEKRKAELIMILSLTVIALAVMTTSTAALKYNIDGDPSDWGIDILTGNWSLNDTWVPNDGVEFIVEDNTDPQWSDTYYGVHIKGVGSSYTRYYEDKVHLKDGTPAPEPVGGEIWDLEAKYLDEDDTYIYVLLVTSVPSYRTGDLALDLDGDSSTGEYGYEYGVTLGTWTGISQWDIYYSPDWEEPETVPENAPSFFQTGGYKTGNATGNYSNIGVSDNGYDNYVIEMAIPKDAVGMAGKNLTDPPTKRIHIADTCGNDHIDNPIPEFLTIVIPVLAILGLIYVHRRKWRGKGRENKG